MAAAHFFDHMNLELTPSSIFKVDKPKIQVYRLLCLLNLIESRNLSLILFNPVCCNNAFIIKLVKIWPSKALDVMVRTLKIRLNYHFFYKEEFSRVLSASSE